jgi:hypothetical protein
MRGSPNALSASRIAAASAAGSSAFDSTRRMPRPPPPATALAKSGKPISSDCATSSSMSSDASVERSTGTPAAIAWCFAVTLLPAISRTDAGGPMKTMPFSAALAARSGVSERKP